MSLHNYLKQFRQEIEKLEDYGYSKKMGPGKYLLIVARPLDKIDST
jgi:hypothetical protein